MRTQEEILKRIEERKEDDFFGFEVNEYVEALDFEHAKPFLKADTTPDQWSALLKTDEAVLARMKDYVEFAYEKIDGERGISANRTIMHYIAWLWLVGNDELGKLVENEFDTNYRAYGRSIMDRIVAHYGWEKP